ncbi:type II toxin-antitoxin system RelE/ParE family toxin [Treponema sp.]|uniref:type II toxin-antitoxin system RelE/ParE family toxin n=1 Tax=Treponema sp. TaxID=166 RepID=UPI003890389F
MTENTIHYSELAKQDLDEIYEYILLELQNPTAAQNTITGILSEISSLKLHPKTGKLVSLPNGLESEYRFVMYKNYLAFYRHEDNDIYIDRVLYGKRDYLRILF